MISFLHYPVEPGMEGKEANTKPTVIILKETKRKKERKKERSHVSSPPDARAPRSSRVMEDPTACSADHRR